MNVKNADGVELAIFYSGGRLRTITDPFGRTGTYSYDSRGRLVQVSGETCGTMTYTYDSYGMTSIYMEKEKSTIKKVVVDKKITREVTLPKKREGIE